MSFTNNLLIKVKNKILYILFIIYDEVYFSKKRIFSLKPVYSIDSRKISVVITYYNRDKFIYKAFFNIINDDRVDEILIVDDFSTKESIHKLDKLIASLHNKKIKVIKNHLNLGMYKNKINAISLAKNDYLILLDSDNTITKKYLDSVYSIKNWDNNTMYCPSFAMPFFDNRKLSGQIYHFDDIRNKLIKTKNTINFLNIGNFFVNKSNFMETFKKLSHSNPISADSAFINYKWLSFSDNRKLFIPKKSFYIHRIHSDSTWNKHSDESTFVYKKIESAFLKNDKELAL